MKKLATYLATVLIASVLAVGVAPSAHADVEPCDTILSVSSCNLPPTSNVCEASTQPLLGIIATLIADEARVSGLLAAGHAREVQLTSKVDRQAATIQRLRDRLARR